MKRILITLVLLSVLGASALAFSASLSGCTRDSKAVTLAIGISDDATADVIRGIKEAFASVAASLPANVLVTGAGFQAFADALTDEEKEAIESLSGPPVVSGSCSRAQAQ